MGFRFIIKLIWYSLMVQLPPEKVKHFFWWKRQNKTQQWKTAALQFIRDSRIQNDILSSNTFYVLLRFRVQ